MIRQVVLLGSVIVLCTVVSVVVVAQRTGTVQSDACDENSSCFPWRVETGPFCFRGSPMGLRFFMDMANEDRRLNISHQVCGINTGPNTSHYVTYAFCPLVDELQAFNLTDSGKLAATYVDPLTGRQASRQDEAWLRVYGAGTVSDREFPQRGESPGAVMITGPCPSNSLKTAITPFLILNLTMEGGRFKYYADFPQPAGVGFTPTCSHVRDDTWTCNLDSSMECFGPANGFFKNCAFCYDNTEVDRIVATNIQIWTSYYGDDANGRNMQSGTNNPLNFRAYAGGNMYSSLSTSLDNVRSGDFNGDPDAP